MAPQRTTTLKRIIPFTRIDAYLRYSLDMRSLLIVLSLVSAPLHAAEDHQPNPPESPNPPNIVIILADDLGWGDVACQGQLFQETPAIDALAADGVRFTAAYSAAPNCAPSRAGLITGQYSPRHGIYTVGSSARGARRDRQLIPTPNRTDLDISLVTLPEVLAAHGYTTASIGKWHLGDTPLDHGFHINIAGTKRGSPRSYFSPYRNAALPDGPNDEYLTDRLAHEAERFIEANRDRPFLLYLSHFSVHTPLQGRPDLTPRFREKRESNRDQFGERNTTYAAVVAALDESVAAVMAALDRLDLRERTLVIFMSDNGGHGAHATNTPFRGAKGMFYEGGIRVPLFISWPGHAPAGTTCSEPVIAMDLFPTILDAAGIDARTVVPHPSLDGLSLRPLIEQTSDSLDRPALFWHFPAYLEPYRRQPGVWRATPGSVIRAGDWKLIETFEEGRVELFNLREDPGERIDLSSVHPERAANLRAQLAAWRAATGAPVPTERNPEYAPRAAESSPE